MSFPIPRVSSLFCLFAFTGLLLGFAEADPSAELAAFSAFKKVDVSKLAGGKPLSESASGFKFSRGAALQACYVIKQPMKKVLALQQSWNPAKRPGSKVFLHGDLSAAPVLADFSSLTTAPDNVAVRSLVRATESLDPANPALQMSAKEAAHFKGLTGGGSSGAIPEGIAKAWENLLFQRASAFAAGGVAAQPEYFSQKEPLRASAEAARLLQEQPKIQAQFKALLSSSGLEGAPKEPATLYYELFDVEGSGALSLGAYFQKGEGERWQAAEVQYYSSAGYYVLLTLYQYWPISVDGHPATLVWRGDLLSSASLGELRGVEKLGSLAAMKKEIQKSIALFVDDANAAK